MNSNKYHTFKDLLNAPAGSVTIGDMMWDWVTSVLPTGGFENITTNSAKTYANTLIRINYSDRKLSCVFAGIDDIPELQVSTFVQNIVKSISFQYIDKWTHYYRYTTEEYQLTNRGFAEYRHDTTHTDNSGSGNNKYYGFNSSSGKTKDSTSSTVSGDTQFDEEITRTDNSKDPAELMTNDRTFWDWSFIQSMISDILNNITLSIY